MIKIGNTIVEGMWVEKDLDNGGIVLCFGDTEAPMPLLVINMQEEDLRDMESAIESYWDNY